MTVLPLLALLVPGLALGASPRECKKISKQIDQMATSEIDAALAVASRWAPECVAWGLPPESFTIPLFHAYMDESAPLDVRRSAAGRILAHTWLRFGEGHEHTAEWLESLGWTEQLGGDYDRALQHYQTALAIHEALYGDTDVRTAFSNDNVGSALEAVGRPEEALPYNQRALDLIIAIEGADHPDAGTATAHLAGVYDTMGDLDAAVPLYERALQIREAALGPEAYDTATSLDMLASVYVTLGRYDDAEPLEARALRIREGLAPESAAVATSLVTVGDIAEARGDYAAAKTAWERSLEIRAALFGPRSPITARSMALVADAESNLGHFDRAEALLVDALQIHREATPGGHREGVAETDLGLLLYDRGRYTDAEPHLRRALEIALAVSGPDSVDRALADQNLAVLAEETGDTAGAESGYLAALGILERERGPDHPILVPTLDNLAQLCDGMGRFREAAALYERALGISTASFGPDHPKTALIETHLGSHYRRLGQPDKAIAAYERALAAQEAALGPSAPDTLTTAHNLAGMYADGKDYESADALYERVATASEASFGPEHPETATSLANLGALRFAEGRYDEAQALFERALAIREKALGPDHPVTAETRASIGSTLEARGDYDGAIAAYAAALEAQQRVLGPDHPDVAVMLGNLVHAERAAKRPAAVEHLRRELEIQDRALAQNLLVGSPADQRAYLWSLSPSTFVALQMALEDPSVRDLAFTAVLRRKARSLDAETLAMASSDQGLVDQLRTELAERDAIARKPGTAPEAIAAADARIDTTRAKLAASASTMLPPEPTIAAVAAELPADAALVEIVAYWPSDPTKAGAWELPRYAAFVLKPDGTTTLVDLGAASTVDAQVGRLRTAVVGGSAWDKLAAALRKTVVEPLHVEGARRLYFAPDGDLALIPPALLFPDAQTVSLSTGRELLRPHGTATGSDPVVISAVDYGVGRTWPLLAGAASEGQDVAMLLGARSITGSASTEGEMRALHGPRVLHVATHGFFDRAADEPQVASAPPDSTRGGRVSVSTVGAAWQDEGLETAIWRSGLVLAGANGTDGRGYLTAAEVATLDLHGTRLVVLSACETGVGAPRLGEGVMGLRHALVVAGSDTQVLSLWKVDDAATKALMSAFYRELGAGRPAAEALGAAQREVAANPTWAHPRFWAAFVLSGDPDVTIAR